MYFKYILYVISVIFTYIISKRGLIPQLNKWITEANEWSKDGKEMFGKEYSEDVEKPYKQYKKNNLKLGTKTGIKIFLIVISIFLVVVNGYMLGEFFSIIWKGGAKVVLYKPVIVRISTIIALVIVAVEYAAAMVFAYWKENQIENPEEISYAKSMSNCWYVFLCLLAIETGLWAVISVSVNFNDYFEISATNFWSNFFPYLLCFIGIGVTLFEWELGKITYVLSKTKGESFIFNTFRYIFNLIRIIIVNYFPYILGLVFSLLFTIIIKILEFYVLIGDTIIEIFTKKNISNS